MLTVDGGPVVSLAPCIGKTVYVTSAAMGIVKAIIVISFAAARADRFGAMNCANASITGVRALQAALKDAGFSQR